MRDPALYIILLVSLLVLSCKQESDGRSNPESAHQSQNTSAVSLVVLGTVQDAGSPHIACEKECCRILYATPHPARKVVSLGIIDHDSGKAFLIEATPDITTQLRGLMYRTDPGKQLPDGIFLTHAHIGHYTGLMYLGREAVNASKVPVYSMPRMKNFLETNGPWGQLVDQENISLRELKADSLVQLTENISITPLLVPHRDEYSETVGYRIDGPERSVVFMPDIDKWNLWDRSISDLVKSVDYAFLDATFYSGDELNTRDISEIPHPFIIESMELFDSLSAEDKSKIYFIHFNHTNPVLDPDSEASKKVHQAGYHLARLGDVMDL